MSGSAVRLGQTYRVVRQMGLRWAAYRAGYALSRRSGWLERRMPAAAWGEVALGELAPGMSAAGLPDALRAAAPRFLVDPARRPRLGARLRALLPEAAREALRAEAADAAAGTLRVFGGTPLPLGWPPAWHRHAASGERWPPVHWSRLSDGADGDVKWLWEPARLGVAYTLVRAHWIEGDEGAAETFWRLVESLRAESPPNVGPLWMCGQECALRALALSFALYALVDAPATSAARCAALVELLAALGRRVEGNLGYAISQRNNHGLNEALALYTLGAALPFCAAAPRWIERGRRVLEQEAARQIADDGSYAQQSIQYHRLALQALAWGLRLGELQGRPLGAAVGDRAARATRLLHALTDEASGRAPNHGSNDGAELFRLDGCAFEDQRPALALAAWVTGGGRLLAAGPWDEPLAWLCGEAPLEAPVVEAARAELSADDGGWYTLRARESWALLRASPNRERPAQADQLHVDLWWRGANLLGDPGTYSYSLAPPWDNALARTGVHDTVEVDGLDQMERAARFTWLGWSHGTIARRAASGDGRLGLLEGAHDGYRARLGVTHRRALVAVDGELWVIIDDLVGEGLHDLAAAWLLPEAELERLEGATARLRLGVGPAALAFAGLDGVGAALRPTVESVRGEPDGARGWWSPRYLHKEPRWCLRVRDRCALPARRVTLVALGEGADVQGAAVTPAGLEVGLSGGARLRLDWAAATADPARPIVRAAALCGPDGVARAALCGPDGLARAELGR